MINERLFPNIVRKTDNDEKYVNDPTAKRFPLLQLYDELSQKQDTLQILLVGEGSIGKSTSLRLLQAELMIRGIYCARYECRHLNDRSIPDIRKEMEQWPKDTVVMIDAYDELNPNWSSSLDYAVTAIRERGFSLIVTSRQEPIGTIYEDFTRYEVQEFSDEQIEEILGDKVDNSAPVYELLRNTMFFSMYLHMDRHDISVKDIEDEASFMLRYFVFLLRDKKETNDDLSICCSLCCDIGHAFYLRFTDGVNRRSLRLPSALRHIVTEEWDIQNGYTVSASQIKYENFFLGYYIMKELTDIPAHPSRRNLKGLFDLNLPTDYTDAYVYAGQLLRKEPCGWKVLSLINKKYPKRYCQPYTHILLMYLGMNKGCFNCGEIGKEVFEPRFFGLRKVRTADIGTKNDHPIFDIGADTFIFYSPVKDFQTNEKTTGEPDFPVEIPAFGFYQCRWLVKINIPDDIAHIGTAAFLQCNNLHSVSFSRNITTIENYVFSECHSLQEITLHEGITHIGFFAFQECKDLRHLTIPKKVEAIMEGAFWKCCSLKNISILSSNAKFSRNSFSNPLPRIRVPHGSTPWYRSQLPPSCTIIETDFEQNIDIEQENELTL